MSGYNLLLLIGLTALALLVYTSVQLMSTKKLQVTLMTRKPNSQNVELIEDNLGDDFYQHRPKRLLSPTYRSESPYRHDPMYRPRVVAVDGGVYPLRDEIDADSIMDRSDGIDGLRDNIQDAMIDVDRRDSDFSNYNQHNTLVPHGGMISSVYPNACAKYGSSSIYNDVYDYFPSQWCDIGFVSNPSYQAPYTTMKLQAQFFGMNWRYQALDSINNVPIRLPDGTKGTGSNMTLRTGDTVQIPSKTGNWTVTIVLDPTFVVTPF